MEVFQALISGCEFHLFTPVGVEPEVRMARLLALRPRPTAIFAANVLDNVRYGRPDASDDEVRAACAAADPPVPPQGIGHRILREANVGVTPGIDFGRHRAAAHVRFAYTIDLAKLEEIISRFLARS